MKAISLHQPWASLVADGEKTIETRKWGTQWRGELLICSSAKPKGQGPTGVALAVVDLVDCRPMTQEDEDEACCPHEEGRVAWELENIRKLAEPFPVKGKQRVFEVDESKLGSLEVVQASNEDEKEEVEAASAEPEQDGEPSAPPTPPSRLVERLPVRLTSRERVGKYEELRNVLDDMDEQREKGAKAKAEAKAAQAAATAELETLNERFQKLRRQLRLNEERRPVECERQRDYDKRIIVVVRLDTGETVRTRPMTDSELQLELPVDDGGWQGEVVEYGPACDAHVKAYLGYTTPGERAEAETAAQEAQERAQEEA